MTDDILTTTGRRSSAAGQGNVVMGIIEVVLPILIGFAVIAGLIMVIDRRRRTPGDTEGYDRLTDAPRPPEAHRPLGVNDTYHH